MLSPPPPLKKLNHFIGSWCFCFISVFFGGRVVRAGVCTCERVTKEKPKQASTVVLNAMKPLSIPIQVTRSFYRFGLPCLPAGPHSFPVSRFLWNTAVVGSWCVEAEAISQKIRPMEGFEQQKGSPFCTLFTGHKSIWYFIKMDPVFSYVSFCTAVVVFCCLSLHS